MSDPAVKQDAVWWICRSVQLSQDAQKLRELADSADELSVHVREFGHLLLQAEKDRA